MPPKEADPTTKEKGDKKEDKEKGDKKEDKEKGGKKEDKDKGDKKEEKVEVSKKPLATEPKKGKKGGKAKKVQCPGLEYLKYMDCMYLIQTPDIVELLTGWQTTNEYRILNKKGQQAFICFERTNEFELFFKGQDRGFIMHVVDNNLKEVLRISRQGADGGGACGSSSARVDVESPPGQFIGSAEMEKSCCTPEYMINDHRGRPQLCVKGEKAMCMADHSYNFELLNLDGVVIGQIYKEYAGRVQEAYTNADNYIIKFPKDLSVAMKAVILAAAIQIDYVHFEESHSYYEDEYWVDDCHHHHYDHGDDHYWC